MSFPRAKIQRFNEKANPTPSPADYNVLTKTHVAGAVIPKTDRFVDRSPASSEHSSVVSSVPGVFRTPNVIPKRLRTEKNSSIDSKKKLFRQPSDVQEQLKEKTVECSNKDQTIREFIDQIEEYKQLLNIVTSELSQIKANNEQLQSELRNSELEKNSSVEFIQEKYIKYVDCLHKKSSVLGQTMEKLRAQYEELKEKNNNDLKGFLSELESLQNINAGIMQMYDEKYNLTQKELSVKESELEEIKQEFCMAQEKYAKELDKLKSNHEDDKNELKHKLQNALEQLESSNKEIQKNEEKYEFEKRQILEDGKARVEQLTENFKDASLLAEMQMEARCRDIEDSWRMKLDERTRENDAILKECQDIAEYNIIQCELEKNHALSQLTEVKTKCEDLEQQNNTLNKTLADTLSELSGLKERQVAMEKNMTEVVKDKHLYEMTISKTHKTVEALKQRLLKSDKDVEQLKAELEATESSKIEFESKCNQLMDELDIVCGLCDDKEEQNCLALKLCEQKVAQLEEELRAKVEFYKVEACQEVNAAKKELSKTKADLKEAMEQLHNQQQLMIQFQNLTSNMKLDQYDNLSKDYTNLEQKFGGLLVEFSMLKKENTDLKKKNEQQELLIGPFREQLEAYEVEYKSLMNEKQGAEREMKEMGVKYAEQLGHQNQKQKIKHLADLKKKNYELLEGKTELEKLVRKQTRTIENLRKELSALTLKSPKLNRQQALENKENIIKSPSCNRNLLGVFSPGGGPLKERN